MPRSISTLPSSASISNRPCLPFCFLSAAVALSAADAEPPAALRFRDGPAVDDVAVSHGLEGVASSSPELSPVWGWDRSGRRECMALDGAGAGEVAFEVDAI
jgi:hypothetical protein